MHLLDGEAHVSGKALSSTRITVPLKENKLEAR
jgi:hypothetical protein